MNSHVLITHLQQLPTYGLHNHKSHSSSGLLLGESHTLYYFIVNILVYLSKKQDF